MTQRVTKNYLMKADVEFFFSRLTKTEFGVNNHRAPFSAAGSASRGRWKLSPAMTRLLARRRCCRPPANCWRSGQPSLTGRRPAPGSRGARGATRGGRHANWWNSGWRPSLHTRWWRSWALRCARWRQTARTVRVRLFLSSFIFRDEVRNDENAVTNTRWLKIE